MSQASDDQREHAADPHADEAYDMPCAEALIAGTLALMTGHAQACCDDHRALMAQKTASSLLLLSQHPLLSDGFKAMSLNLHARWSCGSAACDVKSSPQPSEQSRVLWHTTPEVIQ